MSRPTLFVATLAALLIAAPSVMGQAADAVIDTPDRVRELLEAGRYYEATRTADRILATEPDNTEVTQLRTQALTGLREYQEGKLREAEELAARSGADPENRLALANAYFGAGRYRSAAEIYGNLPETLRTREVRLRQARALAWASRLDEAEVVYSELLDEQDEMDLRLEYGRLLSWMGTSRLAVERLRAVYDETRTEAALEALANALAWSGQRDEALNVLRGHLQQNPNSDNARRLMDQIHASPDLQIERVERLVEVEPFNLALRMQLARLLVDAGRYGEALRTIAFIEENSDDRPEGFAELRDRARAGRQEELTRLRAQRSDLDQQNPETADQMLDLAKGYVAIAEYDEAISLYERYLRLRPEDTKARIEYARILGWDQRYDASQRAYRKLLAEFPERADLRLEYAQVLSYDQEYATAMREFENLTDLSGNPRAHLYPDVPSRAHFNRGQIYRWFGWQETAIEEQNHAIGLDAGYTPAHRELDIVRHLRPATNLDARYTATEDSTGFESSRFDLQGQKWTSARTAIDGWIGRHQFSRGGEDVNANVFGLGGRYRFEDRWLAWGRAGLNNFDNGVDSEPFWNLGTQYLPSLQSRVAAEYAHYPLVYDVFTIESLRQDTLHIDDLRLHWDHNSGGLLSYLADASYGLVSDDNNRAALHGIVAFRILKSPYLALKADGRYLGYDFRSNRYWSPERYHSLAGVVQIGHNWRERLFWNLEGKYGRSWEADRDSRDLRAVEARVTVPLTDALDLVGAYARGESGDLPTILPGDDFTTYWQRRWYVGVRVKRLFRDEERRRTPYYYEDRPMSESPAVPPLVDRQ